MYTDAEAVIGQDGCVEILPPPFAVHTDPISGSQEGLTSPYLDGTLRPKDGNGWPTIINS